jgi:LDH2 family malate/lactate/ureidoglycolate dehydrogenase
VSGAAITLPGDPERRERERRLREGITLDDGTWAQLGEVAGRLGVAVP